MCIALRLVAVGVVSVSLLFLVYGIVKLTRAETARPPTPLDVGVPGEKVEAAVDPPLRTQALMILGLSAVAFTAGVVGCMYSFRREAEQ
jgi:hypothetical protein